jgi:hypothetical protein
MDGQPGSGRWEHETAAGRPVHELHSLQTTFVGRLADEAVCRSSLQSERRSRQQDFESSKSVGSTFGGNLQSVGQKEAAAAISASTGLPRENLGLEVSPEFGRNRIKRSGPRPNIDHVLNMKPVAQPALAPSIQLCRTYLKTDNAFDFGAIKPPSAIAEAIPAWSPSRPEAPVHKPLDTLFPQSYFERVRVAPPSPTNMTTEPSPTLPFPTARPTQATTAW